MKMSVSKLMICIVMVLAFIGQTLANTIVCCEMDDNSHQMSMVTQQQDSDMMDHSHHTMSHSMTQVDKQQVSADCCGPDCACPANACTNFSIIVMLNNAWLTTHYEGLIVSVTQPTNNSYQSSLFRPPIIA